MKECVMMFLYHVYGELEDNKNLQMALKSGLSPNYTSTFLGSGGGGAFFPEIMEEIQHTSEYEKWINFDKGIVVFLDPNGFKKYLKFPVFSNQIMVFDRSITSILFSYIEDEYVFNETGRVGTMIEPGTHDKRTLIEMYWESRVSLNDFLLTHPYEKPEILVFDHVPPEMLTLE